MDISQPTMGLRLQIILKILAVISVASLTTYYLATFNGVVELETIKNTCNDDSQLTAPRDEVRTYALNDGVKACPCENRTFHYYPAAPEGVHSLCSEEATARGRNQRVVSFSFYGDILSSRRYFVGIRLNAALLPKVYPGWTMRVYHSLPAGSPSLCELSCEFPHLDFCDATKIPGFGDISNLQKNAWRFFPIGDPLVDVAMFRDLDSEFIERELVAVNQWLRSELTFHVMRDTLYHAKVPVLGDVMQHDSYSCVKFSPFGNVYPYTTRRSETVVSNWIGARRNFDKKPLLHVCPEDCRPPENKNWTYC